MSETCPEIVCCEPNPFDYSLVGYPIVTNAEQTIFVPCPEGFVCDLPGVEITIPAGTVSYRPTTAEEAADSSAGLQAAVAAAAQSQANTVNPPRTAVYYFSDALSGSCPVDTALPVGTNPYIIDETTILIPAGAYSSIFGQSDANAKAEAALAALLTNCTCQNKLLTDLVWTYNDVSSYGTGSAEGDHGSLSITGAPGDNVGSDFATCIPESCGLFTLHIIGDYTLSGDTNLPLGFVSAYVEVSVDNVLEYTHQIAATNSGSCVSEPGSFNLTHLIQPDAYSTINGCHRVQISLWMNEGSCLSTMQFQLLAT